MNEESRPAKAAPKDLAGELIYKQFTDSPWPDAIIALVHAVAENAPDDATNESVALEVYALTARAGREFASMALLELLAEYIDMIVGIERDR